MEANQTPEWAYPMSSLELGFFLSTVREVLKKMKAETISYIPDDNGVLRVKFPQIGVPTKLFLRDLAQGSAQVPMETWDALIEGYVEKIATAIKEGVANRGNLERNRLRTMVFTEDAMRSLEHQYVEDGIDDGPVYRTIGGELLEVLAIDQQATVALALRSDLRTSGISAGEALSVARHNTYRQAVKNVDVGNENLRMMAITDVDNYAASALLWLEEVLGKDLPYGAIVGLPTRNLSIVHTMEDEQWTAALAVMTFRNRNLYEKGPRSLSPDIYWVYDEMIYKIDIKLSHNNDIAELVLPQEMVDVINTMGGGHDLD